MSYPIANTDSVIIKLGRKAISYNNNANGR